MATEATIMGLVFWFLMLVVVALLVELYARFIAPVPEVDDD
jgi:hypothetical protein